jgi:hypothetical protein
MRSYSFPHSPTNNFCRNKSTSSIANGNSNIKINANSDIVITTNGSPSLTVNDNQITIDGPSLKINNSGGGGIAANINLYNGSDGYNNYLTTAYGQTGDTLFKLPNNNGSNGYVLRTDGAGNLTWAAPAVSSIISNGNSNVSIPSSNGNVNISAVGNANILVVTLTFRLVAILFAK